MTPLPLRIRQLGYVTDDLEAAAMHWVRAFGAGPFLTIDAMSFADWRHDGESRPMALDIAFGQAGDLMVELIRPRGDWPNVYGATPPRGSRLHHHGYLVEDPSAEGVRLPGPLVVQASLSAATELRYFDCRDALGLFVELISDNSESRAFFDHAEAVAHAWDGRTAPVRPFQPGDV
ncbi:MAG: VOC family protein [Rhizorhabdus sp.]|uniref:VOC family protein n=1 Tax=Rhizorhabdus sp. TaxID=1968843 RepID=UPI001B42456B|nr:VOC family protein [Rhizorhabdus sp.]MBP8235520.1 VOC family protein [Rhizorhabdus sp.]